MIHKCRGKITYAIILDINNTMLHKIKVEFILEIINREANLGVMMR